MTRPGALLVALVVALTACTPTVPTAAPAVAVPGDGLMATVERVVDGDTVVVDVDGSRERVRLLRIDTPELSRDGAPAECLAEAATDALAALLPPGAGVLLVTDVEERDRFGRLLAHVWVDETWVNGAMLRGGWAQLLTIPPNVALDDEVRDAVAAARAQGVGLWDPTAC